MCLDCYTSKKLSILFEDIVDRFSEFESLRNLCCCDRKQIMYYEQISFLLIKLIAISGIDSIPKENNLYVELLVVQIDYIHY